MAFTSVMTSSLSSSTADLAADKHIHGIQTGNHRPEPGVEEAKEQLAMPCKQRRRKTCGGGWNSDGRSRCGMDLVVGFVARDLVIEVGTCSGGDWEDVVEVSAGFFVT